MKLVPQFDNPEQYLKATAIIDFGYERSIEVTNLSYEITTYSSNEIEYIKNAFEYVRDKIFHSADIEGKTVTCSASEVLKAKEGICFAKSHLLAAILRCNQIPTGFCYQKLILDDTSAPYLILHGLNAIYIEELKKWIRLDPRGNKPGVDAQFSIDAEKLAFPIRTDMGEEDIPVIFAGPDANVLNTLKNYRNLNELWINLPKSLCGE